MMEISYFEIERVHPDYFRYAVIVTRYRQHWLFVRQKKRTTFELPGGRREPGEPIEATACRELWEETGALEYFLMPVCAFAVSRQSLTTKELNSDTPCGLLCLAEIHVLGPLPQQYEIAEVVPFEELPTRLSYPEIQPQLFLAARDYAGIQIRKVRPEDAGRIMELNRDGLGYAYPLEKTRQKLESILARPSEMIFIAELGKETVGYIHLGSYDCTYSDNLKNVLAIVVDGRYRGRQIGRRLLMAAENWAEKQGAAGIRLVSGSDRSQAHLFYEACGYEMRKEQKNFIKWFNPPADNQ